MFVCTTFFLGQQTIFKNIQRASLVKDVLLNVPSLKTKETVLTSRRLLLKVTYCTYIHVGDAVSIAPLEKICGLVTTDRVAGENAR
jgi:hypothetical protein